MQNITEFYEALWGDSKLYRSVWYGEKGKPPNKFKWFKSTKGAVEFIQKLCTTPHYNVYHACSLFDGKSRKKVNAKETRAFWLDLDLKDTDFKSVKEMALDYMPRFKDFDLGTKFWLVTTGNGLHVYWTLEKPIENWEVYAKDLKEFCRTHNIKADNARTADSASIMRVPNSWNMKNDKPRKVKLAHRGNIISNKKLRVFDLPVDLKPKATYSKEDFNLNRNVADLNYLKSDINKIAKKCELINEFKNTGLDASEPLWHQALSVVVRCENGAELAHEFSSKSPRYNKEQTEQKLERLVSNDIGPCTCENFAGLDDTFCSKCPLKTKIKSCIQLGVTTQPIKDDLQDIINKKSKKRAKKMLALVPDEGWIVGEEGIHRVVDVAPVLVSRTPFYVVDKLCEDFNDTTIMTAIIRAHTDLGVITFKVPLKLLADDKRLIAEFNSRGIFPYNKKHFKEYITVYMQNISHITPVKAVNSLGWQSDDSFVYGSQGEAFSKTGKPVSYIIDSKASSYVRGFESKGTLEKWREAVELLMTDDAYLPHLFGVLCACGSPLLTMSSVTGFIYCLQGESGSGKTLAHMFATSVWGDPKVAGNLGTKDTEIARLGRSAAVRNLPLRLDEATTLPPTLLSGLIYELVNGRGRARANMDGSLSNTASEWQTLTFITTNRPLLEYSMVQITEAERYRILELYCPMPPDIAKRGREIYAIMEENYGLAGKVIMEFVVKQRDYVSKTLNFYMEKFQKLVDDSKRFWVSCFAVAFTAATIAKKLKLFEVDLPKLYKWAVDILNKQTVNNYQYIKELRGFETRDEFIGALRDHLAGHLETVNPDNSPLNNPTKDIKGRLKYVDDNLDILYVRAPAMNEFIKLHFSDSVQKIKDDFNLGDPKTIRIGKITARMYEFELRRETD
jgi:hypothetical protein